MRFKTLFVILLLFTFFLHLNPNYDIGHDLSDDICDLDGYTMIACTSAEGEVEGESGEIIKLYNGMIFELEDYNYNYSYSPDVGIFARELSLSGKEVVVYKLVIEDEIYDASRIR
jgi:hypothetical protein